jgi:hypothetical protein
MIAQGNLEASSKTEQCYHLMTVAESGKIAEGLRSRHHARSVVPLDAGADRSEWPETRAPRRGIEQEIIVYRLRPRGQVHFTAAGAKLGIAVEIRIAQFTANVFGDVFGEYRADREARSKAGLGRLAAPVLDRGVLIGAVAARYSHFPILREAARHGDEK